MSIKDWFSKKKRLDDPPKPPKNGKLELPPLPDIKFKKKKVISNKDELPPFDFKNESEVDLPALDSLQDTFLNDPLPPLTPPKKNLFKNFTKKPDMPPVKVPTFEEVSAKVTPKFSSDLGKDLHKHPTFPKLPKKKEVLRDPGPIFVDGDTFSQMLDDISHLSVSMNQTATSLKEWEGREEHTDKLLESLRKSISGSERKLAHADNMLFKR
jgi:hypothetical protein